MKASFRNVFKWDSKGSKTLWGLFLALAFVLSGAASSQAASASGLIDDAISVLKDMARQDDADSMADVLRGAEAVAFVPSMMKAGFIIGGEYGEGLILRKKGGKWYGPSFYNMGGGSIGIQAGVQRIAFVLVVNNEEGVDGFIKSRTKLGADVGVAAGPVGRSAQAATDGKFKASIYSYSMAEGLFAGASLDGAVISVSVKRNKEYWKKTIAASDALKQPATDKRILPLIRELENFVK